MDPVVTLIPIIAVVSIVVMIIFIRKFTNDERMAMIEKGVEANILNRKRQPFPNLRYGLLLIGAGLGLLIGAFLASTRIIEEQASYFSMLLIFGGLGLFVSYLLEKKNEGKESE